MTTQATSTLEGISVLVTRPKHQQQPFINLLHQCGATSVSLPCLNIVPTPLNLKNSFHTLAKCQVIIFTSVNAVNCAHEAKPLPWDTGVSKVLAVGPSTAQRLQELGVSVTDAPNPPFNSEALLSLPSFACHNLQFVAIVKGSGGRNHLGETLKKAGISLITLDVYDRTQPVYSDEELNTVFLNSSSDIVTITSNESLLNLAALAGSQFGAQLRRLPLVVNSKRGAKLAKDLGFQSHVLVAQVPGDQGQLDAIKLWNQSYRFKL